MPATGGVSRTRLIVLAAASLILLVSTSALAIGAQRDVRGAADPGPWLAVRFTLFFALAILAGQGLGRAIAAWAPSARPDVAALERRVADLEARVRD